MFKLGYDGQFIELLRGTVLNKSEGSVWKQIPVVDEHTREKDCDWLGGISVDFIAFPVG